MIEHIVDAIKNDTTQSIPYSLFMELALYHPTHGYYMKDQKKIGKKGDFYTSSSVSPIFAEMIASVFIKLMDQQSVHPCIVEMGGGNGSFAKKIVEVWREQSPETYRKGNYFIIETSPYHRTLIKETVADFTNITIVNHLDDIKKIYPSFKGVIFSNEFFDAFPVDVIKKIHNQLKEIRVTVDEDQELVEAVMPLENQEILNFLSKYKIEIHEGQQYEIPLPMCSFLEEVGEWVHEGVVVTIDYGYKDEEWSLPFHKEGSLRGYYKHQLIQNPLKNVGEMDLTTHIHFDKLIKAGKEGGLGFYAMYRQDEFLEKSGILHYLQEHMDTDPFSEVSKRNRAIRSLIMQGGISSAFHVVIQTKNVNHEELNGII
jgi:SAM-dependent MidA family methyltransferase